MRVEIEGVYSLRDNRACYSLWKRHRPRSDRRSVWSLLYSKLLGAGCLCLGVLALSAIGESQNWLVGLFFLAVGICFTPLGLFVLFPQALQVLIDCVFLYSLLPLLRAKQGSEDGARFVISNEGLTVGSHLTEEVVPWEEFNGFVEDQNAFLLSLAQGAEQPELICLPRHFFSDQQAKEFSEFLMKRFPACANEKTSHTTGMA